MREWLLAVDLGGTGVRALVVGADGGVRGRAYRRIASRFPAPGRVEQDPRELWQASLQVMRDALAHAKLEAREVAALGVATQRATALAWEARSGEPLLQALGWQDKRSLPLAERLRARGLPLPLQASATKWLWALEQDAAVHAAAAAGTLRLGTPDVWLTQRLSAGALHVTDPGQASCTGLYDLQHGDWSQPLLDVLGLERGTLPRVAATAEIVGESHARWLGAAIPLAARAGDQQAACFAQGVHRAGEAKLTLGTAAMLDRHVGSRPADALPGTFLLALWRLPGCGDAFCLEGSVVSAGASLEWLVDLGILDEAAAAESVARSVPASDGVAFVPALQGLGTPYGDDGARGLIGGLTRGTQRAHLVRAVLEGIAQRCADVCEGLELGPEPLRVDGGLARCDLLLQTLADLSGRELRRATEPETTALGAALLAGLASGSFASPEACRALLPAPTPFAPGIQAPEREARRWRWRRVVERCRSGGDGGRPTRAD